MKAYLAAGHQFKFADIYLIGDYDDPQAVRLTNWQSALDYPIWGTFLPSVVKRNSISCKIGLDVDDLSIEWTPVNSSPTSSIATANPYQLAQIGFFDNKFVRMWTVFMPTPGDAVTYGAVAMFGGRIANTEIERGKITFTVNSFLDVVNERVPTNVIELTNGTAGYAGATPPPGFSQIPQFNVIAGSTQTSIICDMQTPNLHGILAAGGLTRAGGSFLVFNNPAGATLGGQLARIADNQEITIAGIHYNQLILYAPLLWAPTAGSDTFYISGGAPVNAGALSNVAVNGAGTGYVPGDIVTISGGGGTSATVQVLATGGAGAVTSVGIIDAGQGYVTTIAAATTGGSGSGLTLDLTVGRITGFPYVPAPQTAL